MVSHQPGCPLAVPCSWVTHGASQPEVVGKRVGAALRMLQQKPGVVTALSQPSARSYIQMFCLFSSLLEASSKKDCVALGEIWISPMEQLANKTGLCITQYRLGSSNLVWLEKVSAFSSSLLIFNLIPHLGAAAYLVMCVSVVLPLPFIRVMQRSYTLKLFPFSESAWRCDRLSAFAVLENMCLP